MHNMMENFAVRLRLLLVFHWNFAKFHMFAII